MTTIIEKSDYIDLINKKIKQEKKQNLINLYESITNKNIVKLKYSSYDKKLTELSVNQLLKCFQDYLETCTIDDLELICTKLNVNFSFNKEKCIICYEFMGKQKNSLPCNHWCHYNCIRQATHAALKTKHQCPMCKTVIELPKNKSISETLNKIAVLSKIYRNDMEL